MCNNREVIYLDNVTRKSYELSDKVVCPFCNLEELKSRGIFEYFGDGISFINNKYSVLEGTTNFLLIEGEFCDIGLHQRSDDHLLKLLNIAIDKKNDLSFNNDFEEVTIFKQFGIYSSRSIEHGHIQIIGFDKKKTNDNYLLNSLNGSVLYDNVNVRVILSDNPIGETMEINIEYDELNLEVISKLKTVLNYIVDNSYGIYKGGNYSLSLHNIDGIKFIKLVERKITSTFKSNFGLSIINNPDNGLVDSLKDILNLDRDSTNSTNI